MLFGIILLIIVCLSAVLIILDTICVKKTIALKKSFVSKLNPQQRELINQYNKQQFTIKDLFKKKNKKNKK